MRRRLLLPLILLTLALTACASKPAAPTAADFEVQPGEYRYQDSDIFFVETEKGNYYMNPSGDGVIHFAEPGSHEFHVLCNKPNCGHASADCNAFLEVAFGYYNGHLYGVTLQDQFELIQMDMDYYHTTQAKQAVKTGVATCEKTAPTLTKPGQTFFGPDRLRRLWHGGHSLHCVIPQYGGFLLSVQTILKQEQ